MGGLVVRSNFSVELSAASETREDQMEQVELIGRFFELCMHMGHSWMGFGLSSRLLLPLTGILLVFLVRFS